MVKNESRTKEKRQRERKREREEVRRRKRKGEGRRVEGKNGENIWAHLARLDTVDGILHVFKLYESLAETRHHGDIPAHAHCIKHTHYSHKMHAENNVSHVRKGA